MYLATGSGGGGSPAATGAGVLFRSRDVGETWEQVDLGEAPPSRMFEIAVDRTEPSRVYCVNWGGWVYTSHDGGNSWSRSQVPFEADRSRHVYAMACS